VVTVAEMIYKTDLVRRKCPERVGLLTQFRVQSNLNGNESLIQWSCQQLMQPSPTNLTLNHSFFFAKITFE
jgi:hypothetical protein